MKFKKIYLPKWVAWFILILFIPILISIEYEAFFGNEPNLLMGIVFAFVFLSIITMIFIVSYKRIPYLIIGE